MTAHRLRDWLSSNKIFFETVAAVLLSFMALLMSWQSVRQSSLQTTLLTAQSMPIFAVKSELIKDTATNTFTDHRLTVENNGGPVGNLDYRLWSFLQISYNEKLRPKRQIVLPITGYFSGSFTTGDNKGLLLTFAGYRNNEAFGELDSVSQDSVDNIFIHLRLVQILKLSFSDLLGETHEQYFQIDDTDQGIRTVRKNVDEWLKVAERPGYVPREFAQLSKKEIVKKVVSDSMLHSGNGKE